MSGPRPETLAPLLNLAPFLACFGVACAVTGFLLARGIGVRDPGHRIGDVVRGRYGDPPHDHDGDGSGDHDGDSGRERDGNPEGGLGGCSSGETIRGLAGGLAAGVRGGPQHRSGHDRPAPAGPGRVRPLPAGRHVGWWAPDDRPRTASGTPLPWWLLPDQHAASMR